MAKNNIAPVPGKRKISAGMIIILALLLIVLGIIIAFFLMDSSVVGQCEQTDDCGRYNVFYIQGEGYVCANDEVVTQGPIHTKILMFKYASKKAVENEPSGCTCIANQCEIN